MPSICNTWILFRDMPSSNFICKYFVLPYTSTNAYIYPYVEEKKIKCI